MVKLNVTKEKKVTFLKSSPVMKVVRRRSGTYGENHLLNYWILNFLTKLEQNFSNHETTTQKTDTRQKICKIENRYHKRC